MTARETCSITIFQPEALLFFLLLDVVVEHGAIGNDYQNFSFLSGLQVVVQMFVDLGAV